MAGRRRGCRRFSENPPICGRKWVGTKVSTRPSWNLCWPYSWREQTPAENYGKMRRFTAIISPYSRSGLASSAFGQNGPFRSAGQRAAVRGIDPRIETGRAETVPPSARRFPIFPKWANRTVPDVAAGSVPRPCASQRVPLILSHLKGWRVGGEVTQRIANP